MFGLDGSMGEAVKFWIWSSHGFAWMFYDVGDNIAHCWILYDIY